LEDLPAVKEIANQAWQPVMEIFRKNGMKYTRVNTGLDQAHLHARQAHERAGFNLHREWVTYYRKL